jgi:MoaA/NifB/PqqE/SkfB family radical SAM enzyme
VRSTLTGLAELLEPITSEAGLRVPLPDFLVLLDKTKPILADSLGGGTVGRALALKTLNLCLAKYHFLARNATVLSKPLGLVVDPINNCNLSCPGCVHSTRSRTEKLFDWNSGMLSEDCFADLLRRYGPWALEIMFCNYGEPLMNPKTPRMIALARSYLMRTGLSTNMTSKRFDAGAYVDSGLDFMTLSLDGATQATYERYRKDGDLEQAFTNIRALVAARYARGRENPIISWQFLAFEHNAHEIEAAIAIARELGVDQFVVAMPFDVSWDDPAIHPAESPATTVEPRTIHFRKDSERRMIANFNPAPDHLAVEAIDEAWRTPHPAIPAGERTTPSAHSCQWLYRNMVMDATRRVLPCCAAPKPGADLVFDIFTGAGDPFNSGKYQAARLHFAGAGSSAPAALGEPHCIRCEWNQDTAHTDRDQVDQYLRTVPGGFFGPEIRSLLS